MMEEIPEAAKKMLEGQHFVHLATLMPDGSPQVTPVWVDHEDGVIVINTSKGRVKTNNMERDGRVALSVAFNENPYESLAVQGRVTEILPDDGNRHIDSLAKRYLDADEYPFLQPGEERVIVRIEPQKVMHYGA